MNLANLVVGARFAGAGEIRSADPAMYSAAKTNDLKPMLGEVTCKDCAVFMASFLAMTSAVSPLLRPHLLPSCRSA
eukprot:6204658-Pleurochrysis_carterae.AAC.1